MLEQSDHQALPFPDNSCLATQEAVRLVWESLLEVVLKGGPFTNKDKKNRLPTLVDQARLLFPDGPPASGCRWICSRGYSVDDYCAFLRSVFYKSLDCPISSRWYTVEKSAAYLYLHNCFSLTAAQIVKGFETTYWPGEDLLKEEEQGEYEERKKRKSQKVYDYISSVNFEPELVRAISTCRTRWAFARMINPKSANLEDNPKGITRALWSILEGYNSIFRLTDIFANFLIDKTADPSLLRIGVLATICRGTLYLAEKKSLLPQ